MSLLLNQARSWINSNETLKNSSITLHILYSICNNIFEHPSEIKLRTIKLDNPKFKANVLNIEGAIDLLYLCGFELDTSTNCLILQQVDENNLKELHDLGNLFNSYCSDDVKSPKPAAIHQSTSNNPFTNNTTPHSETTQRAPPTLVRHHDLFHHETSPPIIGTPVSQQQYSSHDFNDEEYLKKQHDLEERRKQLAEEKRIKKEEAMKIKNQSKLDRKEKHDEDEYEHGLNVPQHHATHHQGNTSSNPFYSGMTTYKDLGQ